MNTINNNTGLYLNENEFHSICNKPHFPLGDVFKFSLYRFRFSCTNQLQANSNLSISFQTNYEVTVGQIFLGWGAANHRGSGLASNPAAPGSILGIPKNFSLDVAEIY